MWTEAEIQAHSQAMKSLARSIVDDDQAADDVVQETWLAALQSPPPDVEEPRGWLKTVAYRLARKKQRGHRRRQRRELIVAQKESVPDSLNVIETLEFASHVKREIESLPSPYVEVLTLRYLQDLPVDAICLKLDRPKGTVHSQLRRGLERLRNRVNPLGTRRGNWLLIFVPWHKENRDSIRAKFTSVGRRSKRSVFTIRATLGMVLAGILVATSFIVFGTLLDHGAHPPPPSSSQEASSIPTDLHVDDDESLHRRNSATTMDRQLIARDDGSHLRTSLNIRTKRGGTNDSWPGVQLMLIHQTQSDAVKEPKTINARTDRFGETTIRDLSEGLWRVVPERGRPRVVDVRVGTMDPLIISVASGTTIRGRVADSLGHDSAFAPIKISWPGEPNRVLRTSLSDNKGAFSIEGIDLRSWVQAEVDGFKPSLSCRIDTVGRNPLTLRIGPQCLRHQGIVINHQGERVGGAQVMVLDMERPKRIVAEDGVFWTQWREDVIRSDGDGEFEIEVELSSATICLCHAEQGYWLGPIKSPSSRPITYELNPLVSLCGTVQEQDGNNACAADVQLDSLRPPFHATLKTQDDGSFAVRVPQNSLIQVRAYGSSQRGRGFYTDSIRVSSPHGVSVNCVLGFDHSICGHVRQSEERSQTASWVELLAPVQAGSLFDAALQLETRIVDRVATQEGGAFTLHAESEAPHILRVVDSNTQVLGWTERVIGAKKDLVIDCDEERWTPAKVSGRLRSSRNLDNAELVWINAIDLKAHRAPLKHLSLEFNLGNLLPATYEVRLWLPGRGAYSLGAHTLKPGSHSLWDNVPIPPASRLKVFSEGNLVKGRFILSNASIKLTRWVEGRAGQAVLFDGLFPGAYHLQNIDDSGESEPRELTLAPGVTVIEWQH